MASVVNICNSALNLIGASTISALTEDTKNARLCNQRYEPVRNRVFRSHNWNCLVKRVQLAQNSTAPAIEYDYAYALPSDCLRVLKVHNGTSFVAVTSATAGITDVVDDSSPQLGGNLDLQSYTLSNAPLASGGVFSNPNTISGNTTITTASTTNQVLFGAISVTGTAVLTLAGNGSLTIL